MQESENPAWTQPQVSGYMHTVPLMSGATYPESLIKLDYKCIIIEVSDMV